MPFLKVHLSVGRKETLFKPCRSAKTLGIACSSAENALLYFVPLEERFSAVKGNMDAGGRSDHHNLAFISSAQNKSS